MIKKLDWYILKKFISTALFMVLIFCVIAVAIDTSEKADDFVKSGLSTSKIITQYYFGFVPFIISMIFPLMVFIAVIFFTSKMAGKSELVAILAGGVRFNRMLRPYFIGALLLGGIFWVATQFFIPKAMLLRATFQATYIDSKSSYEQGEAAKRSRNYYFRVDGNTYAGMRNYDTSSKSANDFYMDRLNGTKMIYNLRADYLRWDTAKKSWKLQNATERKIEGVKEITKVIPEMSLNLNLKPNEIKFDKYLKDKMTTPELVRYIKSEESRGAEGLNDYKVERYRRDANPISVFILTMIGAVVACRKTRGGSGLHLAVGIITAAFFVVMDKFSLTFSTKGNFPPLLAAWTPNIIFSIVAIWLYRIAPK
ncbi:YjgP/YjgQ family permease [Niastella caeni]|uniref:YjgP/YjgQ family permease n=1 Tax=Niastella caeni TaxID=2569763 RepID=A0A4S8HGY2_9BACT|nr:LptF/LptG family permease [Niastella caeni]THU33419.1 YjgP/YjgQ family permease [Niastella caeni]